MAMTKRVTPTPLVVLMIGRSLIRKAMVHTMFLAARERDPGFQGCSAGFGEEEEEEAVEEAGWGHGAVVPKAGPGDTAANACVLWCTVAMGCLLRGRPKSSVSTSYKRLLLVPLSRGGGGGVGRTGGE